MTATMKEHLMTTDIRMLTEKEQDISAICS